MAWKETEGQPSLALRQQPPATIYEISEQAMPKTVPRLEPELCAEIGGERWGIRRSNDPRLLPQAELDDELRTLAIDLAGVTAPPPGDPEAC